MCPNCGSTSFDVERQTERTGFAGKEREILDVRCHGCGHAWRAPALAQPDESG
jgi:predicted Zn finger-like uncharacterized protein